MSSYPGGIIGSSNIGEKVALLRRKDMADCIGRDVRRVDIRKKVEGVEVLVGAGCSKSKIF
jgi:hypothetical protein